MNGKMMSLIALAAVLGMLAWSSPAQAALVLTQGGYDAQTASGNMPAVAFSSPLGNHSYSATHNTAWTRSGNHQGAAGVIAAPVGGGPATATSPPNISWHNSGTNGTQTQTLSGTMDASTLYTLSFDGAIRDQGQFGGGANIISNLGSFDLKAIAVGSVDGTLAQQDFAPSFTSTGAWQNFSLSWDSTGKDLSQTVTIAIGASDTHPTVSLQFLTDSVTLGSGPAPPPSPLSLLNGGFDDDGTLSGVVSSITGWQLTNFNAGWQTGSPPPVAPPTSSPNVALLNSNNINRGFPGTELTSDPLTGSILPGTEYTVSFDAAIRDQGQFGGGQNIINNLGPYSLVAELVGSVDGVLASIDVAPLFTSVNNWHPGSLVWDSTGATAVQDVQVVLRVENTGGTDLQFVMDSVALTAQQAIIPEPASCLIWTLGLLGLAWVARRRKR